VSFGGSNGGIGRGGGGVFVIGDCIAAIVAVGIVIPGSGFE